MKTLLFLGVFALSFSAISQSNFWKETNGEFNRFMYFGYEFETLKKERNVLAENNVRQRERIVHSKKYKSKITQEFDREGRIVRIKSEYPKRVNIQEYDYNSEGLVQSLTNTNSKGKKSKVHYTYNAEGQILSSVWKNYKSEYYATFHKYNESGKKILTQNFRKDSLVPYSSLQKSYYDDGSPKSTIYKRKGKIKHEWKYDCKPEGELVNVKQKDKSTICVKEERDANGNRVVWTKEFNEKGELTKIKSTYKADSILTKSETFNLKGDLISISERNDSGGFKASRFNKKGKQISFYESFYNDRKQETKFVSSYKNYSYTRINKYENSLKTLEVFINRRSTSVYEFDYKFY